MNRPRTFGSNFGLEKIHSGTKYNPGNYQRFYTGWGSSRTKGFAGAIGGVRRRSMRKVGFTKAEIEHFRDEVGTELQKSPVYSKGLDRRARRRVLKKLSKDRQGGKISKVHKKYFKKLVNKLSDGSERPTDRLQRERVTGEYMPSRPETENMASHEVMSSVQNIPLTNRSNRTSTSNVSAPSSAPRLSSSESLEDELVSALEDEPKTSETMNSKTQVDVASLKEKAKRLPPMDIG